jgi:midasin
MLAFAKWFKASFHNSAASSVSIRDLLAWVDFINKFPPSDLMFALVHGAAMVYIDTLGANPAATLSVTSDSLGKDRDRCLEKLSLLFCVDASRIYYQPASIAVDDRCLCVGPFRLPMCANSAPDPQFVLDAPTTIANSIRIARGLQLSKPILLEGSPGVGKTTLVAALARTLGKPLTRINLSDQTDLTDLFGSDVPVEGGNVGQFAWRDAPFLRAMQCGNWVLLDEMNLASQSVLEGLNSCLDHRQQVYIAELDQVFKRHPDFVLFATQNPHHQGGGRKGLPASFVNRFTVVYVDSFNDSDLERICGKLFPGTPSEQICKLIGFINLLNSAIQRGQLGTIGGPWEINLRDMSRWLQLATQGDVHISLGHFLNTIIGQRFHKRRSDLCLSTL